MFASRLRHHTAGVIDRESPSASRMKTISFQEPPARSRPS
jgi:hypothetical protein